MISVLVPTEGRERLVRALLDSLTVARKRRDCEVIVVDSSAHGEAARLAEACASANARYVSGPRSVRAKRNLAAREASGELLVFVDSDCAVDADFLDAWQAWYERPNRAEAAAGPTVFPPPDSAHTRRLAASSLLAPFSKPAVAGWLLWATASNFAVTREAFFAVGGFLEDLPFVLGGDDLELCLRLTDRGRPLDSWPAAVVRHGWDTWRSPWSVARRSFRWGRALLHVLARHPRRASPGPPDLSHFLLGAALLGVVAAVRWGAAGPLALPFVFGALAILTHAIPAMLRGGWAAGWDDIALGALELPFAFGHLVESLKTGRPDLAMRRIALAPEEIFAPMVADLWANVLALTLAVPLVLP